MPGKQGIILSHKSKKLKSVVDAHIERLESELDLLHKERERLWIEGEVLQKRMDESLLLIHKLKELTSKDQE